MSDTSQGPGWWQASDGKWYPPEQAAATPPPVGGPVASGYNIGDALSYGWNGFMKYVGQIILIWVVVIAVQIVFNMISRSSSSIVLSLIMIPVTFIVSWLVQLGLVRAALAVTEGRSPEPSMLFDTDQLGPYIIATLLFGLAIFVGLLALCIGALIAMFFLWFYPYFVLDAKAGPTDALTGSFNLVKDNAGDVIVFAIVAIALSVLTCGLAAPVVQIASAYTYKVLSGKQVAPVS